MLDIHTLKMHDSEGMYRIYDKWSKIAHDSYHSEYEPVDFGHESTFY